MRKEVVIGMYVQSLLLRTDPYGAYTSKLEGYPQLTVADPYGRI